MKLPAVFFTLIFSIVSNSLAEPRSVYFGTGNKTQGIYRAEFDAEKGRLSEATLAAEIVSPGFLAITKDRSKLYAIARVEKSGAVVGYEIDNKGSLTEFTRMQNPGGSSAHLAIHPTGRFLITAQYGSGNVGLFPLDDAGQLGEPTIINHEGGSGVVDRRQNSPHPHWCGFSPDGKYALVPDLGLDQIVIYKVDPEKKSITHQGVAQSVPGGGPRHMRFSVDGRFIYLLNELSLSITTFAWDAETGTAKILGTVGTLSEAQKSAESFNSSAEILVHPNGQYVYSSNRGHDSVSVFKANSETGELSLIQIQPIRGAFPRNINLDPTATWLLAAGQDSNTIACHKIDPDTGTLTYQRGAIINVPSPICILFK